MLKFTETEWEIINHRLGAPDAIAEVLEEVLGYDYETVFKRAYNMQALGQGNIDFESKIDMDILKDCCEGCNLFCDIKTAVSMGDLTKGKMLSLFKAAKSLGRKLETEVCDF